MKVYFDTSTMVACTVASNGARGRTLCPPCSANCIGSLSQRKSHHASLRCTSFPTRCYHCGFSCFVLLPRSLLRSCCGMSPHKIFPLCCHHLVSSKSPSTTSPAEVQNTHLFDAPFFPTLLSPSAFLMLHAWLQAASYPCHLVSSQPLQTTNHPHAVARLPASLQIPFNYASSGIQHTFPSAAPSLHTPSRSAINT